MWTVGMVVMYYNFSALDERRNMFRGMAVMHISRMKAFRRWRCFPKAMIQI